MRHSFGTKFAQSLLMFSILLVFVWALIIVVLITVSVVAGWGSGNAGVDFAYGFAFYPHEGSIALSIMFIAAIFLASRIFHWGSFR